MANTLTLCSLLDSDKLIEPNFDSWYQKLKIVLEHEKILYVLTDQASEEPTANAPGAARDIYIKWLNHRMTVHCMMRAAMNDEFSRKFKDTQSEKIIQLLNESFGTPEDAERHKTSCAVFNARMWEGASVTDHVLYMIEQIEHLSKFDFPLHKLLGKDAILNSLSKSYLSFLSHYRMTKPAVNYYDLLELLQTFKKDHQLQKEPVNLVGGSSAGRWSSRRGKK